MSTFLTADGAELHYDERGPRGTIPLLFLHGWLADARVWTPVIDRLAEGYRTLAVDLRGFGRSSGAPGPYRVETLADDLSALVASLDLDPLVAIGHSMGGGVAQRFAIDRPDAVEGLVLVASVPPSALDLHPKLDAMFRATIANEANAAAWLAKLFTLEPDPNAVRVLRSAAAATPAHVARENYESWSSLGFGDEAATIATPTLVLAASDERPLTPELARERIATPIAGSRFSVLEKTNHYAILERPDAVARAIRNFVESL